MGIYREGYRHYTGELHSPNSRYLVLVGHEFRRLLAGRWTRRLLYLALFPLAITVITLMARMAESAMNFDANSISNEVFNGLLISEIHIAALLAAVAGAGIIADDRHTRALILYLSRPLSPSRYMLAKGMSIGAVLAGVMVLPAIAYVATDALVTKNVNASALGVQIFTALVPTTMIALAYAGTIVLLSTFASKAAYVTMAWLALFYGTGAVASLIAQADSSLEWLRYFSLPEVTQQMAAWALQNSTKPEPWLAWLVWMALVGIGWWRRTLVLRSQAVSA